MSDTVQQPDSIGERLAKVLSLVNKGDEEALSNTDDLFAVFEFFVQDKTLSEYFVQQSDKASGKPLVGYHTNLVGLVKTAFPDYDTMHLLVVLEIIDETDHLEDWIFRPKYADEQNNQVEYVVNVRRLHLLKALGISVHADFCVECDETHPELTFEFPRFILKM